MKTTCVFSAITIVVLSVICTASDQPSYKTVSQTAFLKASDNNENGFFGTAVAIASGVIVVGAANQGTDRQGEAYVFVKSGNSWKQAAELTSSQPASGEVLGESIAISSDGNVIFAGAPEDYASQTTGSVYVFVKPPTGWTTDTVVVGGPATWYKGEGLPINFPGLSFVFNLKNK